MNKHDVSAELMAALNSGSKEEQLVSLGYKLGLVRFVKIEDPDYNFADLCGDTYNALANPGLPPSQLAREKKAFYSRVRYHGVWGLCVEVRRCAHEPWGDFGPNEINSIWGLIGDEVTDTEYARDFVNSAAGWLANNVGFARLMDDARQAMKLAHAIYEEANEDVE